MQISMNKLKIVISILFATLPRLLPAIAGTLLVYLLTGGNDAGFLLSCLWIVLPSFGTFLLEKRAKKPGKKSNPFFFFVGEAVFLVIILFGNGAQEVKALLAGCLILLIPSLFSYGTAYKNLLDRPVAAELLLFLWVYLEIVWEGMGFAFYLFLYVITMAYVLCFFYEKSQYGWRHFFKVLGNRVKKEQEQAVREVNKRNLAPFLSLVFFISLIVWIPMGSQALADAVTDGYSDMVEKVDQIFEGMREELPDQFGDNGGGGQEHITIPEDGELSSDIQTEVPKQEAGDGSIKVLTETIMVLLAALILFILFHVMKQLSKETKVLPKEEQQEDYQIRIKEENIRLKQIKEKQKKNQEKIPIENAKIRRVYRELLEREMQSEEAQDQKESRPFATMTPEELEEATGLVRYGKEQTVKLHSLYEKARYGMGACSSEEMREAEILSKQMRKKTGRNG